MRKDFGSKPMLYPMPVLIIGTYGEDGTPNAMNAAWGGIVDTNLIGICLADHKTTRNIFARKAFTVSMAVRPVRPPIRPERKNSVQPMMWPMTIAAMPFPIPSGAKAVPVRISARETPAPNQIRLF